MLLLAKFMNANPTSKIPRIAVVWGKTQLPYECKRIILLGPIAEKRREKNRGL